MAIDREKLAEKHPDRSPKMHSTKNDSIAPSAITINANRYFSSTMIFLFPIIATSSFVCPAVSSNENDVNTSPEASTDRTTEKPCSLSMEKKKLPAINARSLARPRGFEPPTLSSAN